MLFVVDECVPIQVEDAIRAGGDDLVSIRAQAAGIDDDAVLRLAVQQEAVLITADKGFGELVFSAGQESCGVLLLRLHGLTNEEKAAVVAACVATHRNSLANAFSVLTPNSVRIRPRPE